MIPHAPNTANDDPSTTNSRSSVRRVNWNGGRGGGLGLWFAHVVLANAGKSLLNAAPSEQSMLTYG